jgi:transposase-like protein
MKDSEIYRSFCYPATPAATWHGSTADFRAIEELVASRGIIVTYETIH